MLRFGQIVRRRKQKYTILLIGVIIVLLLVAKVSRREPSAPVVEGLKSDVCYAQIDLSWDANPEASAYRIYMSDDGKNYKLIGETEKDTCNYTIEDYEHDTDYYLKVSACTNNKITGKQSEGKQSKTVKVKYDSSKYAQKIPILTYHDIVPADSEPGSNLEIKEDDFEEQMKYLHRNGYTTITPDEFYQWHAGKKEFPVKTVMITFDDGFRLVYELGYPIIKKYNMAATLFCIGKKSLGPTDEHSSNYVRKEDIEKVRKEYPRFVFESHTYDMHETVNGVEPANCFTFDQIVTDCEKNKEMDYKYLAYPWGKYSETMQEALKECGYKMAFAYRPFYYALRSDDTYAVNRIKVKGDYAMSTFISIVDGSSTSRDNPAATQ